MKSLDETARTIACRIGLTQDELIQRKAFLEFGQADVEMLRDLDLPLSQMRHVVTEKFFNYLMAFPTLSALLPDTGAVERLRLAHDRYFSQLTVSRTTMHPSPRR
ncbi:protoglobin domain-containing protein [Noviherbaspirillum sp.]|jgi:hypothetical protein|uniref:protoglobin domain-containing protein n=1 Tax=Noviherbaspirillum sp. TaxID=1926288 RepID=UPI0025E41F76|nr:protoglobin domain-containing protein [Noviherbaspirillum sp.]